MILVIDRSARQRYAVATLFVAFAIPAFQLILLALFVGYVATSQMGENPGKLLAQFSIVAMILALLAICRNLQRAARRMIYADVSIIFFRPFRVTQSNAARRTLAPVMSRLGNTFTVFSDGFQAVSRRGMRNEVFFPTGNRFGDKFRIDADGRVTTSWKMNVLRILSTRNFAIIDVSAGGEGLRWEIELAESLLPTERIIYLAAKQEAVAGSAELEPSLIRYGTGFGAGFAVFRKLRRRILQALPTAQFVDARTQRKRIEAAVGSDTDFASADRLLAMLAREFDEPLPLVWWYLRQAVVDANEDALYWLNATRGDAEMDWLSMPPKARYGATMRMMAETYPANPDGPFTAGPRATSFEHRLRQGRREDRRPRA